ncbi:hypothetical protein [Reinekea blandensis]|uniref:Uncharacterized protein n=1 Tax=Reinekea blandensis MED297 TaxID=314283 RepID=A4BDU1_9GAMM|nr:hypothetical protein [Reinekea blandensis]EAR09700.1 hypothetical protein MED297_16114 [Reinekea blandensis MED297]
MPFITTVQFLPSLYMDTATDTDQINCQTGQGSIETLEYEPDSNEPFDLLAYQTTRYDYQDCVSPEHAALGVATIDGTASLETRFSGLNLSVNKYSATNFYLFTKDMTGNEKTTILNGSWLAAYSLSTEITSIEFKYLLEQYPGTGLGTFLYKSLATTQKDGTHHLSGHWVIEDANGETIEFTVSGAQDDSVFVTARGVAMGEYDL